MLAYLSQRVGQVCKPISPPDNGTEEQKSKIQNSDHAILLDQLRQFRAFT